MKIPEIREELHDLANELRTLSNQPRVQEIAFRIKHLAEATKRRPFVKRRVAAVGKVTPAVRVKVRHLNAGRVSEILSGPRI